MTQIGLKLVICISKVPVLHWYCYTSIASPQYPTLVNLTVYCVFMCIIWFDTQKLCEVYSLSISYFTDKENEDERRQSSPDVKYLELLS